MKKLALFLFAAFASLMVSTGTAHADRGIWFDDNSNWSTVFNIVNNSATSQTITVTFYGIGTGTAAQSTVGSTSQTLAANAIWNFSTSSVGSIARTTFSTAVRGSVKISTGGAAGSVSGDSTIFNAASNSGFQFRVPMSTANTSASAD